MAGEEAAEGSRARRQLDLNLYVGLPPLPPSRVWLDTLAPSLALMPNSTGAASEAPRTGEPEESLAPTVAYSPSNTLSVMELDPIVHSRFDGNSTGGEGYTNAPEPAVPAPVPVEAPNVSGPQLMVARSVHPSHVAIAAGGMEMVNTGALGRSTHGAAVTGIDAGAPDLCFVRVTEISQQHNIVRPGSANLSQRVANTDADSLVRAIPHTHSSFGAVRGQNPDGGDNSGFECSICLERARQPVVTSCGHLFCWPCLYQWLHAQSPLDECPVCKGEVLKRDVTPIYGKGGEEEAESIANPGLPPRPRGNRRENTRQQLQMAQSARERGRVLRQMIQNQNQNQGWGARDLPIPAGLQMTSVPAARQRAGARRQQRQDTASGDIHSGVLNVGNVASESSNQNQLPHSNGNNAAQVVFVSPQQSTFVAQLSISRTTAAVVGEPGSTRRSRPSESPDIRRTRRRPQ